MWKSGGLFITDKIQENQRVRIGFNKFKETEAKIRVRQQKTITQHTWERSNCPRILPRSLGMKVFAPDLKNSHRVPYKESSLMLWPRASKSGNCVTLAQD